jgi:hypothetical protein
MKLMVEQGGKWIDYIFIHVKTSFNLNVKTLDGKIVVGLKLDDLKLEGEFAPGYKPNNTTFLADDFAESLKIIVELFTEMKMVG